MLVCGDVFEHAAPSPDAEKVVYDALVAFEQRGIPVVLIAGNHDHPGRWRAVEPLLARFAVHVVPRVRRPQDGGVVLLRGRDGSEVEVAALPWVPERRVVSAEVLLGLQEAPYNRYAERMRDVLGAMCATFTPGRCHVLAAHLFVGGAALGGGERTLTVGDIYAVPSQALPVHPQYIALGHVHLAQPVRASGAPAWYAGSLLQLDFGEVLQQKEVRIVDLVPDRPADASSRTLTAGRRLRDVSGTLSELAEQVTELGDDHLRVTLRCDRPQTGLAEQVRAVCPNAVQVLLDYPREELGVRPDDLHRLSSRELYARFVQEREGVDAEPSRLDLFDEVLLEATGETH